MWYLAKVFLPGKQQQCTLSKLIQPSAYADILAQKVQNRFVLLQVENEYELGANTICRRVNQEWTCSKNWLKQQRNWS